MNFKDLKRDFKDGLNFKAINKVAKKVLHEAKTAAGLDTKTKGRKDAPSSVTEELSTFEASNFEAEEYCRNKCQSMSEKGMRRFVTDLMELKRASADEMRKSVYQNYTDFIQTSRRISELEGKLLQMRNLLEGDAAVVRSLAEGGTTFTVGEEEEQGGVAAASRDEDEDWEEDVELSEVEVRIQQLPDTLDVLLAERKVEEALALLEEGEELVTDSTPGVPLEALGGLSAALQERRLRLAEQLAEAVQQPSIRGPELRNAVSALVRLGDGPRAHTLLLNQHRDRLKHSLRALRPSGTSYGGAYTAALSQLVFSTLAAAARDSAAVFGEEPAYASELVLWAHQETERCAALLRRHVLSSSAAAGGLRAAVECVQIALGHCVLLEGQGLCLSPALSRLLRPSVEAALEANLKRIEENVAALAAVDEWKLAPIGGADAGAGKGWDALRKIAGVPGGSQPALTGLRLTTSAHKLYAMMQEFLDDVSPVVSMQLTGATLNGLSHAFEAFCDLLHKALPQFDEPEEDDEQAWEGDQPSVRPAETEAQQLALIGNASALGDELLPRLAGQMTRAANDDIRGSAKRVALAVLTRKDSSGRRASGGGQAPKVSPELQALRRRLQKAVDRLRDSFCTYIVAELMYGEGAEARLHPEVYLELDATKQDHTVFHHDPMPSPPFQALFAALTRVAGTAAEVLTGRERVVTLLLMRLADHMVLMITSDDEFWEGIEERGIGPVGLQQFVLDMHFMMQVAAAGRYSSRALRQVAIDNIARVKDAYARSGEEPNRVLLGDAWFQARAQEALGRLVSERAVQPQASDLASPTAADMVT